VAKLSRADREAIAEKRLFSILAAHGIATARTLEMKISDAGPFGQRIDPHILTTVRNRMIEGGQLVKSIHSNVPWFSIDGADAIQRDARLAAQLPVYNAINAGGMSTRVGQALEIAIYRALLIDDGEFYGRYLGLDDHDDSTMYKKEEPPQHIGKRSLDGDQNLDFLLRRDDAGWIGIECKNLREWMYPDRKEILEPLRKCLALNVLPLIVARRVPYVSYRLLSACGVIFFQFYNQRLPQADQAIADQARDKNLLGYHDIKLGNEVDDRMTTFFDTTLPEIAADMRARYNEYQDLLWLWASSQLSYDEFAARIRRREAGQNEDHDWPDE
jgi:hypothetical protein